MASDLRPTNEYPIFKKITCDTTTTKLQLPSSAKSIRIGSEGGIVYVCQNGATDGGALPDDFIFIGQGDTLEIILGTGPQRRDIFIASKTGSIDICVMLSE